MKIRKIAAVAVTAVLTVTMLTGCTTFNNFKEAFLQQKKSSDVTIQIGIYEPMSGADSDSSGTGTYIGSRLAFRGRLVRASSVAAFKSLSEVA